MLSPLNKKLTRQQRGGALEIGQGGGGAPAQADGFARRAVVVAEGAEDMAGLRAARAAGAALADGHGGKVKALNDGDDRCLLAMQGDIFAPLRGLPKGLLGPSPCHQGCCAER